MGLFGREDRTQTPPVAPQATPAPAGPPAKAPAPAKAPTSGKPNELTVLARATRVDGRVTAGNDLQIDGEVKGTIDGATQVLVAEGARLEATLHSRVVVIAGSVVGDVSADDKIELRPSANVRGNITAPRIVIQDGATFEGQVFMQKPETRKGSVEPTTTPPQTQVEAKPSPQQTGQAGEAEAKGQPYNRSETGNEHRSKNRR